VSPSTVNKVIRCCDDVADRTREDETLGKEQGGMRESTFFKALYPILGLVLGGCGLDETPRLVLASFSLITEGLARPTFNPLHPFWQLMR
jgi:hypothetical protein